MALINCTECNAQISDKAKSCPKCGSPVELKEKVKCLECGAESEAGATICSNCGIERAVIQKPKITHEPKKKSSMSRLSFIIGGLVILGVVLFVVIQNNSANSGPQNSNTSGSSIEGNSNNEKPQPPREKTPEELRQELLEKETSSPLDYVTVSYKLDINVHLLRESEDIINGTISNSATMATFKDVELQVTFSTKTDAELAKKIYTVYEFIGPNGSKGFQIKVVSPTGTKKIGVKILSALAE